MLNEPVLGQRQVNREQGLKHQLSAGQMAMLAVGGSIGTGLLLGSAAAMEMAGPAVILSYVLAAFITWTVALALGELSGAHPAAGSFGLYGDLYLNEWAGFIARAGYWAAIAVSIGAELVASATYMSYWFPSVPALVWVATFSVLLLLINLVSVGSFGQFEYWFAMIKVMTISAFIIIGAGLLFSGKVTAQYAAHGGFLPKGTLAPLFAIGLAIYTFGGVEMVAVTTGESRSMAEIPRAVRLTFTMLATLYLGAIVVLCGVMPWNRAGVTESPFVTIFRQVNVPYAGSIMNFVILTAALSGSNAALYVASRMLFSLSRMGWAPAQFGRLNASGSPTRAVIASSYGIVVALILETWAPKTAFVSILGAVLVGLLLSWLVSLAAHIRFRKQLSPEKIAALPMRSPLGAAGSTFGFILIIAAIFEAGWMSHITIISGGAFIVILTILYFVMKKHRKPIKVE
ncbi:MAG: amino acid transporter, family [Acidobacteriaceae bacterium]|jgi:AAT family amino acid transporter|nr:amino acid transporter, family [Acidobacteriaceae bacterium]